MTITFFSNFFNHHQKPVADEFYMRFGENYTFVATTPMPESFSKSGYDKFENTPYILRSYEDKDQYQKALRLAVNSDVVILGGTPSDELIKERLEQNKLIFRYSERIFKKSKFQKFNPRGIWYMYKKHTVYRNRNCFMLCASAFTANDLTWIGAYPNKMYKWGYFTKTVPLPIIDILGAKKNKKFTILFAVRLLIKLKHPEMAILMADLLKQKKYDFELQIVGSGAMENDLKKMVKTLDLTNYVTFLGNIANDKVLSLMQAAHAFFFCSDRNEGWGAVANEAMANGCTLVASHYIGAAPYLVQPGENGLVFQSGNVRDATEQMERLLTDRDYCDTLALNAYDTITNTWSPKAAANNFLKLCNEKLNNKSTLISKGPCSKANSTPANWHKS